RLRHPRDRLPRQLRNVLADPRPRGGAPRSSRAAAGAHRRGRQPVPLVLGPTARAPGAGTPRTAGRPPAGPDRDRAACRPPPPPAIWLQCHLNAMLRFLDVLRTLGPAWQEKSPFEVGAELFQRILDHPEGVEIARLSEDTNLEDHVGFEDGRIRLAPRPMLDEIQRAVATPPRLDPDYPFVLAAGLRTRWTANTIQRDPTWRKGRGPH